MAEFENSLGVGKDREEEVMAFMRAHGHLGVKYNYRRLVGISYG
jgi:hypothetical protein